MTAKLMSSAALAAVLTITASAAFAAKSPQDFITDAIQGDNSEIALGQVAQQNAADPQVKQFGQTLVADHTQAKEQATAVAKSLNVTPPDGPAKEAVDEKTKLSKLSGAAFDKEFASYMVTDHQKDISEFQDEANAKNGPASDLATKQLPVLKKHLEMAQAIGTRDESATAANGANGANAAATASGNASQGAANDWRASKLVGVAIYGPDDKKVGDIRDIMMSKDGKAELVIIGVGGFLGLGEKDVAIPYDQVKFTDQPVARSAVASGSAMNGSANGNAMNGGASGTAAGNTETTGRAAATDSAAEANDAKMTPKDMSYPNHGVVQMTISDLKAAPTFTFPK